MSSANKIGPGIMLFLLGLLFCSRYLPSPQAVLVADDWTNLSRSSIYATDAEAVMTGLQDPNRPVSMAVLDLLFRRFGTAALPYTIVSFLGNALLIILVVQLGMSLTGNTLIAVLMGVFMALFPNLVETYHWSTQVINEVTCALVWYAASAWMWVRHVQSGRFRYLIGSTFTYMVALFSYEAGLFLPAAYIFLFAFDKKWIANMFRLVPFAVVIVIYGLWRSTNAFGMNESWHYPAHMKAGLTLSQLTWNGIQIMQWWVGDHMVSSIRSGWDGFFLIAPGIRRGLYVLNVIIIILLGIVLGRQAKKNPDPAALSPFSTRSIMLFGVAWTGAAFLPCLVSYTASRLNVLPAIGISLLLAATISRFPMRSWFCLLIIPVFISLGSNQGTTEHYRQAGLFNWKIYRHLEQHKADWASREIVVFDTRGIRQRQTPGLLSAVSEHESTWAQYGNALLFRGFVPRGMIELISGDRQNPIQVVHDVENGARLDADTWRWHERFDPARPRSIAATNAFYVDLFSMAIERK
jgi:hypothetical protein